MPNDSKPCLFGSSIPLTAFTLVLAAASLLPVQPLAAQVVRSVISVQPEIVLAQAKAVNPETVRLLTGLGIVEMDLQLGMMFAQYGMVAQEGSYFKDPRAEIFLEIKDGLAAAGVEDIEPLLVALEAEADLDTVSANYDAAVHGLARVRTALNPNSHELLASIIGQVQFAMDGFNPSGPTEVDPYVDGWSVLMVTRGQIDLLVTDPDPAIAAAASDIALAFDDIILSLPAPDITAPIEFDPAPVSALLAKMNALAGTL